MIRISRLKSVSAALLLCLPSLAQAPKPRLTAEQIVEKNIAARGGLTAWRAVKTMSISGKMQAGGNDRPGLPAPAAGAAQKTLPHRLKEQAELPFELELKRARKQRLELQFAGTTAVQVYDGTNGWKLRPFLNRQDVEPFTADELKAAAMQSDLDGPLVDHVAKGTRVDLDGTEKVDGNDTYRLKLTYKSGQTQMVWIDAKTFLETKVQGAPRRLDGAMHPVEVYYRNYQQVQGGLRMPFTLETVVKLDKALAGQKAIAETIRVEKVVVNPKLDDALFTSAQLKSASATPAAQPQAKDPGHTLP